MHLVFKSLSISNPITFLCLFNIHSALSSSLSSDNDNLIIGVTISRMNYDLVEKAMASGYDRALKRNIYRGNYSLILRVVNTCNGMIGLSEGMHLILKHAVHVIFGAFCSPNCVATAQVTNYWNISYFPLNCFDSSLDNSSVYKTTLRYFGSLSAFGSSFVEYFRRYQWNNVAIMSEIGTDFCTSGASAIQRHLKDNLLTIAEVVHVPSLFDSLDIMLFNKIRISARIIILCHSNYTALQRIMFQAQDLGMTNPSQYAWITFFNIYTIASASALPEFSFNVLLYPWLSARATPMDEYRKQAFLCLKIITYRNSTQIPDPRVDANNIRFTLAQSFGDIFYVYLTLRNLTIMSGKDPNDGFNILNTSRTAEIIDEDEKIRFNMDGDRLMSFYVWSLAANATTYRPYMEINPIDVNNYSVGSLNISMTG
ncbi:hypothetical protein HELRODRAFT_171204 [Helobdella robusta]|uniref:Receptor ligand binding region domain-containing protein n=1 Tax=Helobdella robusta TaxID=6412 RepID=T1F3X7_HELRO|nr:hypothetical protein HELRODRAFT_171204 [Helobdella robusta]ESO05563.1 hypothetical protein HELRODRAFT_171204 [Helobdella robusta]